MPPRFSDSPNARSKSITTTDIDTHGILNRHATKNPAFQIGTHHGGRPLFVVDFDAIRGQGFFAVFDGHAGKHAAEWCGSHFHETLLSCLHASPSLPIPDVLNQTFHKVDENLSRMCEESEGKIHSGCTAVTAFLRVEDTDGNQSFLTDATADSPDSSNDATSSSPQGSSAENLPPDDVKTKKPKSKSPSSRSRIKKALKSLGGSSKSGTVSSPTTPRSLSPARSSKLSAEGATVMVPPSAARRVLYSANAGDARGVLCRAGRAVRLTYDHKGSDKQEAKRIMDAGGFVMSGRVNGVLAVTRSLGDSSMKEFVVGSPYTTETELCDEDEFLVLACDGLWDVTSDQAAVELVREIDDAQEASQVLLQHALAHHTTDNVTVLVVRFKNLPPRIAA
ncbi:phosphatase 2C-like domain-containing protein [Infundibulicybe gibba]|nr:phosphatase 2C-like domain-containing protein [Infundibulicybe gibba]